MENSKFAKNLESGDPYNLVMETNMCGWNGTYLEFGSQQDGKIHKKLT
jgi:hypothetical protein